MKVTRPLENGGILLNGTTKKASSQEGRFLNFLKPLRTDGWPINETNERLMKTVLVLQYYSRTTLVLHH